jgi:hypothetical protein
MKHRSRFRANAIGPPSHLRGFHHVTRGTTATRAVFASGAFLAEIFVVVELRIAVFGVQFDLLLVLKGRVTRVQRMNEFSGGALAQSPGKRFPLITLFGIHLTDRAGHAIAIVMGGTQIHHTRRRRCRTEFKGTDNLFVDFAIGTVAFGNAMKVPASGSGIAIVGSTRVSIAIRIDISGTLVVRKKGRSWLPFIRGALAFGQGRIRIGRAAGGARIAKPIVNGTRVGRKSGSAGSSATTIRTKVTGSRHGVCQIRASTHDVASLIQTLRGGVTRVGRAQVSVGIEIISTSCHTGLVMRGRNVARVTLANTKFKVTDSILALRASGGGSGGHKDGQGESKEEHHRLFLRGAMDDSYSTFPGPTNVGGMQAKIRRKTQCLGW